MADCILYNITDIQSKNKWFLFWSRGHMLKPSSVFCSQWVEQESKVGEKLPSKDWASWFIWPSEAADHQRPVLCKYSSKFSCWVFSSIIKMIPQWLVLLIPIWYIEYYWGSSSENSSCFWHVIKLNVVRCKWICQKNNCVYTMLSSVRVYSVSELVLTTCCLTTLDIKSVCSCYERLHWRAG